jgi:hypothetical protein
LVIDPVAAPSDRNILRTCQDASGEVGAVGALDQCRSSELVAGEYDLKRTSLCDVLGGQKMREGEGVLRVGLRHPLV